MHNKKLTSEQIIYRQQALVWLHESFPITFTKDHKPLKIGIHQDIFNAGIDNMPSKKYIKLALAYYVNSYKYLAQLITGMERIALSGFAVGQVIECEENVAKNKLHTYRKRHSAVQKKKPAQKQKLTTATDANIKSDMLDNALKIALLNLKNQDRQEKQVNQFD